MKNAKKSDRITDELLETALALSKHNVLSPQELNQIKALRTTPQIHGKESGTHPYTQGQDQPSRIFRLP
jgi:hypothetical protein